MNIGNQQRFANFPVIGVYLALIDVLSWCIVTDH